MHGVRWGLRAGSDGRPLLLQLMMLRGEGEGREGIGAFAEDEGGEGEG